jgi:hypothetical protein
VFVVLNMLLLHIIQLFYYVHSRGSHVQCMSGLGSLMNIDLSVTMILFPLCMIPLCCMVLILHVLCYLRPEYFCQSGVPVSPTYFCSRSNPETNRVKPLSIVYLSDCKK